MAAVAHASPAALRRLAAVPVGPVMGVAPLRVPASTYRRRRTVALLVVVTVLTALVLAFHGLLASFGGGPLTASERPGDPGIYVVQPGDTFWGIASRLEPGLDPRPLVTRLVAAHGSPVLVPGERLRLPG